MVIADFSELIHRIARYIMDIIRDEENEQGIAPENPLYILENILPDICEGYVFEVVDDNKRNHQMCRLKNGIVRVTNSLYLQALRDVKSALFELWKILAEVVAHVLSVKLNKKDLGYVLDGVAKNMISVVYKSQIA